MEREQEEFFEIFKKLSMLPFISLAQYLFLVTYTFIAATKNKKILVDAMHTISCRWVAGASHTMFFML